MSIQTITFNQHLREISQVADELRAASHADQIRKAGRASGDRSLAASVRRLVAGLTGSAHSSRLATH